MPRITISYRRNDSGIITGRIFDRLTAHYGRDAIFRDIDDIPPGVDFRTHIGKTLNETDIVLAVIGPKWLGPRSGQSRLVDGADPVRVEIETALRKELPLIPVLVLRAAMPRIEQLPDTLHSFAYRNALSIDAGKDFDVHITRLIRAMDGMLDIPDPDAAVIPNPLAEPLRAVPHTSQAFALAPPQTVAALTAECEALRQERDTFLAEIEQLHRRERMFEMELSFTAEEAAAAQQQLDLAAFAARLKESRRSYAKRMIFINLAFAVLIVTVLCLGLSLAYFHG